MRLTGVCLVLLTTFFVSWPAFSSGLPSSVFCQALLQAGKVKSDLNPLTSLRDIRYRMSKLSVAQNAKQVSPYTGFDLELDLENPRWRPFQKIKVEAALARLAQLENDVAHINFDGTYVGFELRGAESIQKARALALDEINKYESRVQVELRRRYPHFRMATLIQHGMSAFLISAIAVLLNDPHYFQVAFLMAPTMATAVIGNEFLLPEIRKSSVSINFDAQLKTIDGVLAQPGVAVPFHMLSGSFEIRTELHKIFMTDMSRDLNDDEIQLLVDAAEKMYEMFGDEQWISRDWKKRSAGLSYRQKYEMFIEQAMNEAKYFPEGRTRQSYFDSIFYFDKETNDPVWLFFYRAFKSRPLPPKNPKKQKQSEIQSASEKDWVPGLVPQRIPAR